LKLFESAISSCQSYSFNYIIYIVPLIFWDAHVKLVKRTGVVSFDHWIYPDVVMNTVCDLKITDSEKQ